MHQSSANSAQVFSCEVVLDGAHVRRDSVFGEATVRVTYLDEWARIGSIQPLGELRQGRKGVGPGFYYQRATGYRATLADGSTVTLGAGQRANYGVSEASLAIVHQFGVHANEPKTLDEMLEAYVQPLVDLLTLLVDRPSSVLRLQVAKQLRGKNRFLTPYDYYDVGLSTTADPSAGESLPLAAQMIRSDEFTFGDQLPKWFDLATRLGGIRGLVFGLRYAPDMSVENRYLNASTAAEALHRATFTSKRNKVDLKDQETKDWLAHYPTEQQTLINARLNQYINDPSLADRLTELVDKAGKAFSAIASDTTSWVTLVKNTRNDLTHRKGIPRRRITTRGMFVLAESVALLVTICFLIDLGFTPEELQEKVLRPIRVRVLKDEIRSILAPSKE